MQSSSTNDQMEWILRKDKRVWKSEFKWWQKEIMLFDDLICSGSEFKRLGIAPEMKARVPAWVLYHSITELNHVLSNQSNIQIPPPNQTYNYITPKSIHSHVLLNHTTPRQNTNVIIPWYATRTQTTWSYSTVHKIINFLSRFQSASR